MIKSQPGLFKICEKLLVAVQIKLLAKIDGIGVNEETWTWFLSYLMDRKTKRAGPVQLVQPRPISPANSAGQAM